MYSSNLIQVGQKVQFLNSKEEIANSEIVQVNSKKQQFTIKTGEQFTIKTGKQIGDRVGKIIKMHHFKIN